MEIGIAPLISYGYRPTGGDSSCYSAVVRDVVERSTHAAFNI